MCKFKDNGEHNRIDECMKHLIKELNNIKQNHFEVLACCCGHKKYPMTIIVRNKTIFYEGCKRFMTWDIVSGVEIPRKRNLYKKDKQGYYFIPEVIK